MKVRLFWPSSSSSSLRRIASNQLAGADRKRAKPPPHVGCIAATDSILFFYFKFNLIYNNNVITDIEWLEQVQEVESRVFVFVFPALEQKVVGTGHCLFSFHSISSIIRCCYVSDKITTHTHTLLFFVTAVFYSNLHLFPHANLSHTLHTHTPLHFVFWERKGHSPPRAKHSFTSRALSILFFSLFFDLIGLLFSQLLQLCDLSFSFLIAQIGYFKFFLVIIKSLCLTFAHLLTKNAGITDM